jgi:hypothetical protein
MTMDKEHFAAAIRTSIRSLSPQEARAYVIKIRDDAKAVARSGQVVVKIGDYIHACELVLRDLPK